FGCGEAVVAAVADFDGVVVVEATRAAVGLPIRDRREAALNARPLGQRVTRAIRAAVALDVALRTPAVGVLRPGLGVGDVEVVRQLQVDLAAGLLQRLRPRLDVGDVAVTNTVDLDVVDAPRGELVRPRVDEG